METKKNLLFLKGKESAFINILLLVATVVFIVPIVLVFSLRFLYRSVQTVKDEVAESTQVDARFNKVY